MALPIQPVSHDVFFEKYAKPGETTQEDVFRRVAKGIAQAEQPEHREHHEERFFQNMKAGAIGAGRIMSAAGTDIQATLINCFVQPVGDCIQGVDKNDLPGIYEALREAAETLRRGGGVGFNFSRIRPRNAFVKGTHSYASGPCSYMDVFDASCKTVESAGQRRGAMMGILRIDHPDILEFVQAKRTPGRWNNFNVSVYVSDLFMGAKNNNQPWALVHEAEPSQALKDKGAHQRADGMWVYAYIDAGALWDTIMRSNYDYAEPGVLFCDTINRENNLGYVEVLEACNPCGEQNLPDYGCCDLGPIILTRFVRNPFSYDASFDFENFEKVVRTQVRALDNVLEVTLWPLPQQKVEAQSKRRIGIGFTGLGNALAMLGLAYNSEEGRRMATDIATLMRNAAYEASVDLAQERGAFPLFNADEYLKEGRFASRLPEHIKADIRRYGIRNSHLLSIAPTGTVSLAFADNASNGIEPPFSLSYNRKKRNGDGTSTTYAVLDHGLRVFLAVTEKSMGAEYTDALLTTIVENRPTFSFGSIQDGLVKDFLPPSMVTALQISAEDHLLMMKAVQSFIDSSISKTVNVPAECSFEDFKHIYDQAFGFGLKGVATYRPNAILGSVLSVAPAPEVTTPKSKDAVAETPALPQDLDPLNLMIDRRPNDELDAVAKKVPYSGPSGDSAFFVTMSFVPVQGIYQGQPYVIQRPIEVFIQAAANGAPSEWVAAHARDTSLLARSGLATLAKALQNSREIVSDKGRTRYGWYEKADGSKVPRFHGSDVACIAYALQEILIKKGLLDANGNALSLSRLVKSGALKNQETAAVAPVIEEPVTLTSTPVPTGKPCPECGALNLIKRDGCESCSACGHVGSCG